MKNRIYLRALESTDLDTTFSWRNDDEISSMVGGQKYYVSYDKEKKWLEGIIYDNTNVRLMICLKDTNKPIGISSLTDINYINRSAHYHVLIGDKESWGKGYATDALRLMMEYAIKELGLHRIESMVLEDNIGSIKMLKKCGFKEEGVKRDSIFKGGKYHNQVILALLDTEFIYE